MPDLECTGPFSDDCPVHPRPPVIAIDRETAEELLKVLSHDYIAHKYTRVHNLIKRCWELTGNK